MRCQNVCLQTILTDYILIGRKPAAEEMRSINEVGTRRNRYEMSKCLLADNFDRLYFDRAKARDRGNAEH